jgi:hypothetical protein
MVAEVARTARPAVTVTGQKPVKQGNPRLNGASSLAATGETVADTALDPPTGGSSWNRFGGDFRAVISYSVMVVCYERY